MVRKTGSHLSRANAPLVVAQAGNAQSHLKPLADRTACGACETYGTWTVTLPVLQLTVRGRTLPSINFSAQARLRNARRFCPGPARCGGTFDAIPAIRLGTVKGLVCGLQHRVWVRTSFSGACHSNAHRY